MLANVLEDSGSGSLFILDEDGGELSPAFPQRVIIAPVLSAMC